MCFIVASGVLFGVVGSLDADTSPMRVPPQTGSFVFGPLIFSSLCHDESVMTVILIDTIGTAHGPDEVLKIVLGTGVAASAGAVGLVYWNVPPASSTGD
jgi:hypothetical protein